MMILEQRILIYILVFSYLYKYSLDNQLTNYFNYSNFPLFYILTDTMLNIFQQIPCDVRATARLKQLKSY